MQRPAKRARTTKSSFVRTTPYSRRKAVLASRSRLVKTIKAVTKRVAEPKTKRINCLKTELYHNAPYTVCLNTSTSMPNQGVADNERVGDQIYTQNWRLRMLIGQKGDRPNVSFRWFVLKAPKGSSYSYSDWFINVTTNVMLDDINTDYLKVLKSGLWRPNEAGLTATGNDEYTFVKEIIVPYKKLVKFGPADGARTHNDDDIWFLLCAYDAYGSLGSDNVAYIQVHQEVNYKDP